MEEESLNKQMMKEYNKKKNSVEVVRGEYQKAKSDCEKKQVYLQEYYAYLDKKLKSGGPGQINMFATL